MDTTGLGEKLHDERFIARGHSYTAAYRYQLVIGKVGGWAIPYPLTIPQAVTGLTTVVGMMITASWWYPLTGIGGAVLAVVAPVVGVRLIARIRPEGRAVADWVQGSLRGFVHYHSPGIVLDIHCVHHHLRSVSPSEPATEPVYSPDEKVGARLYPSRQQRKPKPPHLRSQRTWLSRLLRRSGHKPTRKAARPIPIFDPWAVSPSIQSEER